MADIGSDTTSEFVPAHTNVVCPKELLDELACRQGAAFIREQAVDVIETEGPVEIAGLTRIVA